MIEDVTDSVADQGTTVGTWPGGGQQQRTIGQQQAVSRGAVPVPPLRRQDSVVTGYRPARLLSVPRQHSTIRTLRE